MKEEYNTIKTPFGEFVLNADISPVDDRDFLAELVYDATPLPEELDLRKDLFPVKSQGSQGSCASFAATCMKEWQEVKDIQLKDWLSPQFIYNNRCNKESSGMYGRDVMKILTDKGIVLEKDYPYYTGEPITSALLSEAKNFVISGYGVIDTIDGLKRALINNGPCYIAVPCYNQGPRMWKPTDINEMRIGGHAMSVVGYNKLGFIIRNSWSSSWNGNGYCIFPYEDWGCQYETYTTLDAKSVDIFKQKPPIPSPKPTADKRLFRGPLDWIWYGIKYIFTLGKCK